MKYIKSLLTGLALSVAPLAFADGSISVVTGGADTFYLLSTNRASIYQVQLEAGATPGYVWLYDNFATNNPFWGTNSVVTNGNIVTVTSYPSNYITSFVGYNGYTNWYTNAGIATVLTTNVGTTNALSPTLALSVGVNGQVVYNVDALHVRGITALASSNLLVTIRYRTAK